MDVRLIVVTGKQTGKEIPITGKKFLIGRGEECQLRPQTSLVSRRHCAILIEGESVLIEDCGSTNGTLLNDQKLSGQHAVKSGDRLKVATLVFEFRITAAAAAKKTPAVDSVQAAAASKPVPLSLGNDDLDISDWLAPTDQIPVTPKGPQPAITGDTMAGKSMEDTTQIPAAVIKKEKDVDKEKEAEKKHAPAKGVGKPPHRPMKPGDSGAAAADMLRQFFHRKKP